MAEAGDVKAQYNVGRCYGRGDGVEDNQDKAIEWLLKAAEQEDPRACFNLYLQYKNKNELEKSEEFFQKALAQNEVRAINAQKERDAKKAEEDKLARESYVYEQGQKLVKGIEQAKAYLKDKEKQKAYELLKELSKEDLLEGLKEALPYLQVECLDHNIRKVRLEDSKTFSKTIRNGNLETDCDVTRHYVFEVIMALRNDSDKAIEFYSNGHLESYGKVILEPGEIKTVVSTSAWFRVETPPHQKERNGKWLWKNKYMDPMMAPTEALSICFSDKIVIPKRINTDAPHCFVLTACYEDQNHPVVINFRNFRNEKLLTNSLGSALVVLYYKHGPKVAKYISDKPLVKNFFRGVFKVIEKAIK